MASKSDPKLSTEAKAMGEMLPKIDGKLSDELRAAEFAKVHEAYKAAAAKVTNFRGELTKAVNEKDAASKALNEKMKRVRDGVRAAYGDDSNEYEMVGGKRRSERRRPVRRTTATA